MTMINPNMPKGINNLSQSMRSRMTQVASSQAGTVRDKKEMKGGEKESARGLPEYDDGDGVMLSKQAMQKPEASQSEKFQSAQASGATSGLYDEQEEEQGIGKSSQFGAGEVYGERQQAHPGREDAMTGEHDIAMDDDIAVRQQLDKQRVMNRTPGEILEDVPPEQAEAAQRMVNNQMRGNKPSQELKSLKPVPDTAMPELDPAPDVEIMPIKDDSALKPMAFDMERDMTE